MLEITILGSGSAGNAALVRCAGSVILVDAGMSAKQLSARLAESGVHPQDLSGILLTHEHGDHTSALRVLLSRHALPVYCNALTARALQDGGLTTHTNWKIFQTGSDFSVADFSVRAFSVPHDASDPVGFRILANGASFGVLTDLGYPTRLVFEALRHVQSLFIETNHEEALLQKDTRRPWSVKQRILSRHGHLSNAAAARVVGELDAPELHTLILGHLSRDCNTPDLAINTVRQTLEQTLRGIPATIHCAEQLARSPVFQVT